MHFLHGSIPSWVHSETWDAERVRKRVVGVVCSLQFGGPPAWMDFLDGLYVGNGAMIGNKRVNFDDPDDSGLGTSRSSFIDHEANNAHKNILNVLGSSL